jgi:DNA-binding response OmpR family regulator
VALVLVIDDDGQVRAFLRHCLERAGHRVAEAEEGGRGLALCREEAPAAVLCDLYMPGKEGLETIRELRAEFPGVPVIAMSGGHPRVSGDFLVVAAKFGAAGTLAKPFSPAALLAAVGEVLQEPPPGGGATTA